MSILNELKQRTNIEPEKIMYDLHVWANDVKSKMLMIESALMTLDAYFKEENKWIFSV